MFLVLIGVLYFNCKQELFACFRINNNEGKKCLFRFQALFFYPFGRSKDVLHTHKINYSNEFFAHFCIRFLSSLTWSCFERSERLRESIKYEKSAVFPLYKGLLALFDG